MLACKDLAGRNFFFFEINTWPPESLRENEASQFVMATTLPQFPSFVVLASVNSAYSVNEMLTYLFRQ